MAGTTSQPALEGAVERRSDPYCDRNAQSDSGSGDPTHPRQNGASAGEGSLGHRRSPGSGECAPRTSRKRAPSAYRGDADPYPGAYDLRELARKMAHGAQRSATVAKADPKRAAFENAVDVAAMKATLSGERSLGDIRTEFRLIRTNHIVHRDPVRLKKEDRPVCTCKPPKAPKKGCLDDCVNRLLQIECHPQHCPCGAQCGNQRLRKHAFPKFRVQPSGAKGWGLFTAEALEAGDLVIEYVGEVVDHSEALRRHCSYAELPHMYIMALSDGEYIDATQCAGMGRFVNHSCEPNCATQMWTVDGEAKVGIFTTRKVEAGEEITFDYKFERFGATKLQECHCGAASCRGVIGTLREDNGVDKFFLNGKRRIRAGTDGRVQDPATMQWCDAAPSTAAHKELAHRVTQLHFHGGLSARTFERARSLRVFLPRNAVRGLASFFAGQDSLLSGAEVRAGAQRKRRRTAAAGTRTALPIPPRAPPAAHAAAGEVQ